MIRFGHASGDARGLVCYGRVNSLGKQTLFINRIPSGSVTIPITLSHRTDDDLGARWRLAF